MVFIFMAPTIFFYFGISFYLCVSASSIPKDYAVNTCVRSHTSLELLLASSLKYAFTYNPPVCSSNDSILINENSTYAKRLFDKGSYNAQFGTNKLKKVPRKKRQAQVLTWRQPVGMPPGTAIAFCDTASCCTPKKTLIPGGNTYNLCRECVHVVTLPGNYSPRIHNHITCQDTDYYETCLSGEGTCTTNTMAKSVTVTNNTNVQLVTFSFGSSCSCEIRTDSIFASFI